MNIKATDAEVSQRKTFAFLHVSFLRGLLMGHIEDMFYNCFCVAVCERILVNYHTSYTN